VFEKDAVAGGSFRYAGKAPLFQEVAANDASFRRYIADMVTACELKKVAFRFSTDVMASPQQLASFDRIVIASGAAYRFGLGLFVTSALDRGVSRLPGFARLFSSDKLRNWFYYRGRRGTGGSFAALARPGQKVTVIGDAVQAGKSKQAISSAFDAALRGGS